MDWEKLQNGSDIRGVAIERGDEKVNLTPETAYILGYVFIKWLSENSGLSADAVKVAIGTDSRITGPDLKKGFIAGAASMGASLYDCGMASTPAMFMSTVIDEFSCHGAVMITASHLPFNRNGFKFFTSKGSLEKGDISLLLKHASEAEFPSAIPDVTSESIPLMERYCSIFIDKIRIGINRKDNFEMPLTGMKIVVDAGNGAGGFFAHNILKPLGADIEGSVFLEPDGMFPNHEPNPENSEAMESIRSAVLKSGANLGIIFDTDVDRSAIVDSSGVIINRNSLIALISAIVLEEHPGTTIVTDSVTSEGLRIFIEDKLGGRHHRFKRGYKNVINEAVRLNREGEECHLAIETSGHGAMKENYFLDDGAYLAARLIIESARLKLENKGSILYLIKDLVQPVEELEFRINLYEDDFASQGKMIINDLERFVNGVDAWTIAPVNYEGIRVSCGRSTGDGWFLLRLSLHDPVLPLNIESDSPGGAALIAGELAEFLNKYENISFDKLQKYISG